MSIESSSSSMAPSSAAVVISGQRSPWHSPIPYLFGGLAAMLGLIAFALLILACSYWKLSGYLDNDRPDDDLESGDNDTKPDDHNTNEKTPIVLEEKYLVIMAGEAKPTYLATPVSSGASSFGSGCRSNSTVVAAETVVDKEGSSDELQIRSLENQVNGDL